MAPITKYVDTDVVGGLGDGSSWANAYSSWAAWNATAYDLSTAGDTMHVYFRGSVAEPNVFISTTWNPLNKEGFVLEAADTDKAVKEGIDPSKYRILCTTSSVQKAIEVNVNYLTLIGIQVERTVGGTARACIGWNVSLTPAGNDFLFNGCYIEGPNDGTLTVGVLDAGFSNVTIQNCIIMNMGSSGRGIQASGSNWQIYNNVIENCNRGIQEVTITTGQVVNNAVFNCNDDFFNITNFNLDYNASDDGDGGNPVGPLGGDWATEFPNFALGDFTHSGTGNLAGAGVGPSVDSNVPRLDIDGDLRSGATCDIGADEGIIVSLDPGEVIDGESAIAISVAGTSEITNLISGESGISREIDDDAVITLIIDGESIIHV
jgi:hypothetical protein